MTPAPRWDSEACCETISFAADSAAMASRIARDETLLTDTQIEQAFG